MSTGEVPMNILIPISTYTPQPILRKSTRDHKPPSYLKDYIYCVSQTSSISLSTSYKHTNRFVPEDLLPSSKSFVMNLSYDCELSSYEEATMNLAW